MCDSVADIPLRLEYPKIGRTDDAEVVGNRVAEDGPVFRHLLAQETQNGIAEVVVGRLAPICASRFYASTPIGARLDQGAGSSWECNGLQSGILALPAIPERFERGGTWHCRERRGSVFSRDT